MIIELSDIEVNEYKKRLIEAMGHGPEALKKAIRYTGLEMKKWSVAEAQKTINVDPKYFKKQLRFKGATKRNLTGKIYTGLRMYSNLGRYDVNATVRKSYNSGAGEIPRELRRKTPVVEVKKGNQKAVSGSPKIKGKPFYMQFKPGGFIAIVGRRAQPGPRGGKAPVALYGPSPAQIFRFMLEPTLAPKADEMMRKNLVRSVNEIANRTFTPE